MSLYCNRLVPILWNQCHSNSTIIVFYFQLFQQISYDCGCITVNKKIILKVSYWRIQLMWLQLQLRWDKIYLDSETLFKTKIILFWCTCEEWGKVTKLPVNSECSDPMSSSPWSLIYTSNLTSSDLSYSTSISSNSSINSSFLDSTFGMFTVVRSMEFKVRGNRNAFKSKACFAPTRGARFSGLTCISGLTWSHGRSTC